MDSMKDVLRSAFFHARAGAAVAVAEGDGPLKHVVQLMRGRGHTEQGTQLNDEALRGGQFGGGFSGPAGDELRCCGVVGVVFSHALDDSHADWAEVIDGETYRAVFEVLTGKKQSLGPVVTGHKDTEMKFCTPEQDVRNEPVISTGTRYSAEQRQFYRCLP